MEELLPLLPQYSKWIMTAILSIIAIVMYLIFKGYLRKQVMIAMILSSLGDIFMTDMFGLGDTISAVPGALFFIIAHFVYGLCFIKMDRLSGFKYKNVGFYVGLAIMVATALALTIVGFTLCSEPAPVMYVLIMVYIAIIGFNVCGNFSYFTQIKGYRMILLPFAIILFYATDLWIFLDMLNVYDKLHHIVWYFYPVAQLILILFCGEFKKDIQYTYIREE